MQYENTYLISPPCFHEKLLEQQADAFYNATTEQELERLLDTTKRGDDSIALVFPIHGSATKPSWPYNPFIGPQEELPHERTGLARIATELFRDKDFYGFKIVPAGVINAKPNANRLFDGCLVSPFGIYLLELKDHREATLDPMAVYGLQTKNGQESNPVQKLTEGGRKFKAVFEKHHATLGINKQLWRYGAVVFTNPKANIAIISNSGEKPLPYQHGDILITTPKQLGAEIKRLFNIVIENKTRLSLKQIDMIAQILLEGDSKKNDSQYVGDYEVFLDQPLVSEGTPQAEVFLGCSQQDPNNRVWIKRFPLDQLYYSGEEQRKALEREKAAFDKLAKQRKFRDRWQHVHFTWGDSQYQYVVLEAVEGKTLTEWLQQAPSREDRLEFLRQLAETLAVMAEEDVVHRALTPNHIRVHSATDFQITHFEFCRLRHVGTLIGPREFDTRFAPHEIFNPGEPLTPASDTYSFGRLVCLVLGGKLPFDGYQAQSRFDKKKGAWEDVGREIRIPADDLRRLHMENPRKRPIGQELVAMVQAWQ